MQLNKSGFTLVELLVAMAFFTFLLLLVTFGFVQINRSYTRGITVKTIQETTRSVLEDLTRVIRTTDQLRVEPGVGGGIHFCASDIRYIWNQHVDKGAPTFNNSYTPTEERFEDTGNLITMVRTTDNKGCPDRVNEADAEVILDDRAAVQYFNVIPVGTDAAVISLIVSTKSAVETDLEKFGKEAACKAQIGDQFCDVSRLETVVNVRN